MKVTNIKTFTVDCFRTNWVFVKVYTDAGIDGVGEATLEYKEKALIGAVEHIKDYLVGRTGAAALCLCRRSPLWKRRCGIFLASTFAFLFTGCSAGR